MTENELRRRLAGQDASGGWYDAGAPAPPEVGAEIARMCSLWPISGADRMLGYDGRGRCKAAPRYGGGAKNAGGARPPTEPLAPPFGGLGSRAIDRATQNVRPQRPRACWEPAREMHELTFEAEAARALADGVARAAGAVVEAGKRAELELAAKVRSISWSD